MAISTEEWDEAHARWPELVRLFEEGQERWVLPDGRLEEDAHALFALEDGRLLGFLGLGFAAHPSVRSVGDERRPGGFWIKVVAGE